MASYLSPAMSCVSISSSSSSSSPNYPIVSGCCVIRLISLPSSATLANLYTLLGFFCFVFDLFV